MGPDRGHRGAPPDPEIAGHVDHMAVTVTPVRPS